MFGLRLSQEEDFRAHSQIQLNEAHVSTSHWCYYLKEQVA